MNTRAASFARLCVLGLFALLMPMHQGVCACSDYPCDYAAVRYILDLNGIAAPVDSVSDSVNGRITALYLACTFNRTADFIMPDRIADLSGLTYLQLNNNYCIKQLPDALGDLPLLEFLQVSGTSIQTIPSSIGRCKKLKTLICGWINNPFTLPPEICSLSALQTLHLGFSPYITTIPDSIGKLTNLDTLILDGCPITQLPESIVNLVNLQSLDLRNTLLTALPAEIGNLVKLPALIVMNSRLQSLPASICNLTNLQSIAAWGNRLTSLPDSLNKLTGLKSIDLDSNCFTSIPLAVYSLPDSARVILSRNKITTIVVPQFSPKRIFLDLSRNQIASIPDEIAQLQPLKRIDLNYNNLDTLPDQFMELRTTDVSVDYNKLCDLPHAMKVFLGSKEGNWTMTQRQCPSLVNTFDGYGEFSSSLVIDFSTLNDSCVRAPARIASCPIQKEDVGLSYMLSTYKRVLTAGKGIIDLGWQDRTVLKNTVFAPDTGYRDTVVYNPGHLYAIKTDESNYALLLIEGEYIGGIDHYYCCWSYLPDGSREFNWRMSSSIEKKGVSSINSTQKGFTPFIIESKRICIPKSLNSSTYSLRLYSINGKLLVQKEFVSNKDVYFPLKSALPGVYLCRISGENYSIVFKLSITK